MENCRVPETTPITRHQIARRPCTRCGWDKSVKSMMMPKEQTPRVRLSECPMCGHFEGPRSDIK